MKRKTISDREHSSCEHNKTLGQAEKCCANADKGSSLSSKREWTKIGISLFALILSYLINFETVILRLADISWIAIIICGYPICKSAYLALSKRKITASVLITIAIFASIVMGILDAFHLLSDSGHSHGSYFFVAGEVAFLMAIGGLIEEKTAGKSKKEIETLINLHPKTATVKTLNSYEEIDIEKVEIGDVILVKPNTLISVDGVIIDGESFIDESTITGEHMPKEKKVGDNVYQGTFNKEKAIEIKASKRSNETVVAKVLEYVKKAELNKAHIAKVADKWAGFIVPIALVVSVLVFIFARLILQTSGLISLQRAITILVVFCPCALALATPTAISAAIGRASKLGVLIKSGTAVEALSKINVIAFDKTGTLTEGNLKVEGVVSRNMDDDKLMQLAASAEMQSEHPIAKAILNYNKKELIKPSRTESLVGIGVKALVGGKEVKIVKKGHLTQLKAEEYEWLNKANSDDTTIIVFIENKLEGIILLSDTIREGAKQIVGTLKKENYLTTMLTGDNEFAAKKLFNQLSLNSYIANLLPIDKVNFVEEEQRKGNRVLMLGDGVNDAPAMAKSNCSIAMGAIGNDVAIETADISIMNSDITKLPLILDLAKKTIAKIKINIALSMIISVSAIIFSAYGFIDAVLGAFIHNASSILVCLNSALLLKYKYKKKLS